MHRPLPSVVVSSLAVIFLACSIGMHGAAQEKAKENQLDASKIPEKVMSSLKHKFPKAVIAKVTKEKEGDKEVYDIEFTQEGKKFEADIFEDGVIHNWERAIDAKELPEAVAEAVEKKYPKSTLKEVMVITEVQAGKDKLEGYEIVLTTTDKKEVEVTVAPDGKILEDSSEAKKE